MKKASSSLFKLCCLTISSLLASIPVFAQEAPISADGTTDTTVVTPDNSNFDINGGDRAGSNLFHSFGNFSVPIGGEAFFNNADDIQNIISRVTGGKISDIQGAIAANGGANLFLINPAGIVFGPNASLNIGGSFLGSTADSLLFSDGTEFSATNSQGKPLLTINAPIGLNLRDNPQPIANNSVANNVGLQVRSGKNISLIGGDINFDGGRLFELGGRVSLGGLTSAGEVRFDENGNFRFPDGVARGDVSLSDRANVLVFGEQGGNISINAKNLNIFGGSSLLSAIVGLNNSNAQPGNIEINATDKVSVRGEASLSGILKCSKRRSKGKFR